jgi:hypothetical protein
LLIQTYIFDKEKGDMIEPKETYFRKNRTEYGSMGTEIDDDEFYALSADELRDAIEGSVHDTRSCCDSDGCLIIVSTASTDEFDTELTEGRNQSR